MILIFSNKKTGLELPKPKGPAFWISLKKLLLIALIDILEIYFLLLIIFFFSKFFSLVVL